MFISDDISAEIRKIHKLLWVKRDKLRKVHEYDAWILRGIQSNLFVNRTDGSVTKYSFSDNIPEIDDFLSVRGAVHHSFRGDVSIVVLLHW